jgi:apolipoprotein N-acyltransferase
MSNQTLLLFSLFSISIFVMTMQTITAMVNLQKSKTAKILINSKIFTLFLEIFAILRQRTFAAKSTRKNLSTSRIDKKIYANSTERKIVSDYYGRR